MAFQITAMENDQEDLQFMGFLSIFKESLKIILTWLKIFLQIILAFILPNSFIFLANHWISKLLFGKIHHNLTTLDLHQLDSPTYNNISKSLSKEWATYWLIKALYFISTMVFALLSTSAVVYTVACIYSGKQISFRKVISVVPKVWKRLMITFLCNACIMFAYMLLLALILVIPMVFLYKPGGNPNKLGLAIIVVTLVVFFLVGFFYMTMVWQLANVISVMEKSYGFRALVRSKELMKGKMGTSFAILVVINICSMPILELIHELGGFGLVERICLGVVSLVLWSLFSLFGLVVHTIFYLVCKSYHHESIDKSLLADHLDVYLSEYVPLKSEVQLEQV